MTLNLARALGYQGDGLFMPTAFTISDVSL
jgi:hypothetical protein